MTANNDKMADQIRSIKKELRNGIGDYRALFKEIETHAASEIKRIRQENTQGRAVPQINFQDLNQITEADRDRIKRAGCLVIRNTLPKDEVSAQNEKLGRYIVDNGYYEVKIDPEMDQYFDQLKSDRPQIFGLYWSQTQVWARQHPHLAEARSFLNRLWEYESLGKQHFDPDRECSTGQCVFGAFAACGFWFRRTVA